MKTQASVALKIPSIPIKFSQPSKDGATSSSPDGFLQNEAEPRNLEIPTGNIICTHTY